MYGNDDGASAGVYSWLENQVNQLDEKKKQYEKSVQFNIEQSKEEKTHKKPRLLSEEIKKASQPPPKSPTHPKLLLKNIQQKLHGEEGMYYLCTSYSQLFDFRCFQEKVL